MNLIKKQRWTLSISFMFCFAFGVSAQEWQKVVPLQTTCEEVKKLLVVNECKTPVSRYKFPDISVYLNISDGNDSWKVPKGTVTRVSVGLRNLPKLKDVLKDLNVKIENFEVFPDDDLPNSKIYVNNERGISITVQEIWSNNDEEYVTGVDLFPQTKNRQRRRKSVRQVEREKVTPAILKSLMGSKKP